MVHRRGDARLALEPCDIFRIGGVFFADHLERDHAVEIYVAGLVHRAHAARAEDLHESKIAKLRASADRGTAHRAMDLFERLLLADVYQRGAVWTGLEQGVAAV